MRIDLIAQFQPIPLQYRLHRPATDPQQRRQKHRHLQTVLAGLLEQAGWTIDINLIAVVQMTLDRIHQAVKFEMAEQSPVFAGDITMRGQAQMQRRIQQTLRLGQVVTINQPLRGEFRQHSQPMIFRQIGVQGFAQGFRFQLVARRDRFQHRLSLGFAITAAFRRQGKQFPSQGFRLQITSRQGEFGGIQSEMSEAAHNAVIGRIALQSA